MSSSDDSGLKAFLNPLTNEKGMAKTVSLGENRSFTLVQPGQPVNWVQLAMAILSGVVVTISVGIQAAIEALRRLIVEPIVGMTEFVVEGVSQQTLGPKVVQEALPGLIDAILGPITRGVSDAWKLSLDRFGAGAYLVALGFVLVSFWLLSKMYAYVRARGVF